MVVYTAVITDTVTSWTDWVAIVIAVIAVIISIWTAWIQIKYQKQEWGPYLSYSGINIKISRSINRINANFSVRFRNDGKCVLQYKIIEFKVKILPAGD